MRCVHIDFHTSPLIEGIGTQFNAEEFTKTLRDAKVNCATVFAKCHHGYCYYPTKVGEMHPHLHFNLLKAEIDAIHAAGAKAPIYITMGWSKKDADEHPEWRQVFLDKPAETVPDDPETPIRHCCWTKLCPAGGYKQHLMDITREICEQFDVSDGIIFDICFMGDHCVCESCSAGMREMGLDPTSLADARAYYRKTHIEMMKDLTGLIHSYAKDALVFYNGGADQNRPEYHPYLTHYMMEDLPTAWGGYDFMPPRAKFFERYGKYLEAMTGKFHHNWGEFGGFKNKDALKYECADMASLAVSPSIGDHLHPLGKLDESTYDRIGYAFDYYASIEKYSENTRAYTDFGIWASKSGNANMGASKLAQLFHMEFDVVASGDDLSRYACLVLPEGCAFSAEDKAAITAFVARGGALLVAGESGFSELGIKVTGVSPYDNDFICCDIDGVTTPFLSYTKACIAEVEGGEVLAQVYEPYFSRTYGHFCGHKNTPNKPTPADYPALVKKGSVMYFAHPVFTAYNASGNYVLECYVKDALMKVYTPAISVSNLPSSGRVRLRRSEEGRFYALHLLYAPPVNRGNVCLLEDFPTLADTRVSLSLPERVTGVRLAPENTPVDFTYENGRLSFALDGWSLHRLVVIDF